VLLISSIASADQDIAANLDENLPNVPAAENDSCGNCCSISCKTHNHKSTLLQFNERAAEFPLKSCGSFIPCMATMITGSLSKERTRITTVGALRHFAWTDRGDILEKEM
jgi:hypothetical protein